MDVDQHFSGAYHESPETKAVCFLEVERVSNAQSEVCAHESAID